MKTNSVDGNAIAQSIAQELRARIEAMKTPPVMGVLSMGDDPVTHSYVGKKRAMAETIGVEFRQVVVPSDASTQEVIAVLEELSAKSDGVVVQLPLGEHIDTDQVLTAIEPNKDVDCLAPSGGSRAVVGPVAGAVLAVLDRYEVDLSSSRVVVIGRGKLVGAPVADALRARGIEPVVLDKSSSENEKREALSSADVVISGVGAPGLVTPDMVREGVVLVDAGTSSSQGTLQGDIHPDCAEKAALYTPTPGGIGPITIAVLYRNLLDLYTD